MTKIARSCGTHDGTFHADEVTACALLVYCDQVDENKIYRTRDSQVLEQCEYVCDVGGEYDPSRLLFDHHQADYRGTLSSAGMVLAHLREQKLLSEDQYHHLNQNLVTGVDAHDNGKAPNLPGVCTFSHIVSNYTPIQYRSTAEEQDFAFHEALRFVLGHLRRTLERLSYVHSCQRAVEECMVRFKECLIFDEGMPWLESFFELGGEKHPAQFVIMPSGHHWKLRGIPPSYSERMKVRTPLPSSWAGLLEEELQRKTGIPGAIFCHKERFISVWETKEDALKALDLVMQRKEKIS